MCQDCRCDIGYVLARVGFARDVDVVMFVLGKERKEFDKEDYELVGHLAELGDIGIRVDVGESSADRLVNKKKVGELIPRTVVVTQGAVVFDTVRSDFHQRSIFGTAAWTAVEPDDGLLTIRDMSILVVPEEEIAIVFGINSDVPGENSRSALLDQGAWGAEDSITYPACIFSRGPSGAPGKECTK